MPAYTVDALVELLGLSPHPEGGYFRETFRSADRVQRPGDGSVPADSRAAGTAIYFLLPAGAFSAWHRVASDEAWHHYDGAPVELHTIDPAGVHRVAVLGRDLARGERPQQVVPAGWFQAARPVAPPDGDAAGYALCGCTVSPGFEFADFELPGRAELRRRFPQLGPVIDMLTRS
jgi:predicted cupin superfamily sugar epimerase